MVKGVYTLIIKFDGSKIKIGSLGEHKLPSGYYAYTGSALGKGAQSLKGRILRHLRRNKKTKWHIDYLLMDERANVEWILLLPSEEQRECSINSSILENTEATIPVKDFGSSDCRSKCPSHLLYLGKTLDLEPIKEAYNKVQRGVSIFTPSEFKDWTSIL